MKHIIWKLFICLLLVTTNVMADSVDRLMRLANRYFEPLPDVMPGSENDTPQLVALGKKTIL